jgi:hypothetical protein
MQRVTYAYLAAFIAVLTFAGAVFAQTPLPTRLRGTVVALDGLVLTVATREGPEVKVTLDEKFVVGAPRRLAITDIKPNSGTAAVPAADGTLMALEVVIIPEASRGSGDGHYG